ncbi:hypothetical protein GIB67_007465, partial [Kingdonia uniflora]
LSPLISLSHIIVSTLTDSSSLSHHQRKDRYASYTLCLISLSHLIVLPLTNSSSSQCFTIKDGFKLY